MLTSNDMPKEDLDKPFIKIQFVMDPPEELRKLKTRPTTPTLFVEVVLGNEKKELSRQWIPLPCLPKEANAPSVFDTNAIMDFMAKCAKKNKYLPHIRPASDANLGRKLSLRILTNGGECQLVFSPSGHVCLNNMPADLDLNLKTMGSIKTGADLQCRAAFLSAKNIRNAHAFLTDAMQIKAAKKLINSGLLSGKNSATVTAREAVINKTGAVLTSDGNLEIHKTPQLINQGLVQSKAHLVLTLKSLIENQGALMGGKMTATVSENNPANYSFINRGDIATTNGDFSFIGQGISHTAGSLTAHGSINITATNINLPTKTTAVQNIALHHGGGIWVVTNNVKAEGELGFYLPEGKTITEPRTVPGSLRYALSPTATQPLCFMADQEASSGAIHIDTPMPVVIGNAQKSVSLKANQALTLKAKRLDLVKGRLLSITGICLKTVEDLILGRENTAQVALLTHGPVEMEANGLIGWYQLEMTCGGDCHLKGRGRLVNTSSQIRIKGNAIWEIPTSHRLLIQTQSQIVTMP